MNDQVDAVPIRVVIEFATYSMVLEGEEAEKWNRACLHQAALAQVHGVRFPDLEWERFEKRMKNAQAEGNEKSTLDS